MKIKNAFIISFLAIEIAVITEQHAYAIKALVRDLPKLHLIQLTIGTYPTTENEINPKTITSKTTLAQSIKNAMKELCNQHAKVKEKDVDVVKACEALGCSPEGLPKC